MTALLAALGASAGTKAADLAAGKAKAAEVCQACHGIDGNSPTADFPKIGGQYPDYLAKALRDYKSGLRKNPIMAGSRSPVFAGHRQLWLRTTPRSPRRSPRSPRTAPSAAA
jgi:cytochrome c553